MKKSFTKLCCGSCEGESFHLVMPTDETDYRLECALCGYLVGKINPFSITFVDKDDDEDEVTDEY